MEITLDTLGFADKQLRKQKENKIMAEVLFWAESRLD